MKRTNLILLFLTATLLYSCKEEKNVFTVDQNKVTVKEGTEFILKIVSNQSTGFKWLEDQAIDTNLLDLNFVDYQILNKKEDGGGGYEYWHFKALKKGETEVRLKYVRPWENSPAAKMVNFKIVIE